MSQTVFPAGGLSPVPCLFFILAGTRNFLFSSFRPGSVSGVTCRPDFLLSSFRTRERSDRDPESRKMNNLLKPICKKQKTAAHIQLHIWGKPALDTGSGLPRNASPIETFEDKLIRGPV